MITEDFVSFEIAKLLRKKGFNERCNHCYYIDNKQFDSVRNGCNSNLAQGLISAPTLQMTMKWLREVHKCCIVVNPEVTDDDGSAGCLWGWVISIRLHYQYTSEELYESYEQACEAAIRYCLENLI